ncbi:hypothetical protein PUN28_014188 [Cardiocondyla obscurior]|uniref:Uncharacterized protein n=1 Tax=Cardiocondyla obscurior TaxID=286306 RepID=A0AAW2F035_9HYME
MDRLIASSPKGLVIHSITDERIRRLREESIGFRDGYRSGLSSCIAASSCEPQCLSILIKSNGYRTVFVQYELHRR